MSCADYDNRPRICREFSCGRPCEGCGECCSNVVLMVPGWFGDDQDVAFYALHGVKVEQHSEHWTMTVGCPCRNWVPE